VSKRERPAGILTGISKFRGVPAWSTPEREDQLAAIAAVILYSGEFDLVTAGTVKEILSRLRDDAAEKSSPEATP
jgi:hypothetical protein